MDQIKIENLEIFANHGVYPEENRLGQKFLVSCILYVDTRKAGKTDDLEASVNYGTISHLIKEKMEEKNYRLIEAVAEQLAEEILLFDEKIRKVMVEVKKPWAPVGLPLETVSVKIERCWNEAFIALGSNMGDKKKYIENAVEELKNETRTIVIYEAPHRLVRTLKELRDALGNRSITLCRELTKKYEEADKTTIDGAIEKYNEKEPKGEFVLVIEGKSQEEIKEEKRKQWEDMSIEEHMEYYVNQGNDKKAAMKLVAKDRGVSKRDIYNTLIKE